MAPDDVSGSDGSDPGRWRVHGERLVDDTRMANVTIALVELPNGVKFEQYVIRMPRAAMVVVLDEDDRVLLLRRHRFIIDRWVWELPGGYVDVGEDPAATASREVEEETGWRPGPLEPLVSFQPLVGTVDSQNDVFLARSAEYVGEPDINEPGLVEWIPLDSAVEFISRGEIVGSGTVIGLLKVLAARCGEPTSGDHRRSTVS
jgi:8-oxo-dGTP pyrophosphatase MutT (NUDIX family)